MTKNICIFTYLSLRSLYIRSMMLYFIVNRQPDTLITTKVLIRELLGLSEQSRCRYETAKDYYL